MTENEAIKELETSIGLAKMCTQNYERKKEIQCYEMAINALKEIQKYRKIGTVEECRAAVEKQTAKRPDYEGDGYSDGQLVYDTWICPCCGQHYEVDYDDYDYCPECGQHIDKSNGTGGRTMGRLIDEGELMTVTDIREDGTEVTYVHYSEIEDAPTAYDLDKVVQQLEERTAFLKDCTKYGNKTTEQQSKSYDTMMMYEVKDLVDDLLEIVKEGGSNEM